MAFAIRPARVPDDAPGVCALINLGEPEPLTPDEFAHHWAMIPEGSIRHRLVAEDEAGAVIGYGAVSHNPWDAAGRWFTTVFVQTDVRRQGIGSALFESLAGFVRPHGVTKYAAEVRENDPGSLAWAQARGFRADRHLFESTLDLTAFDEAPFAGVVEAAEATGIRFFTLADAPGETMQHRLYELVSRLVVDIPGWALTSYPPFAEWARHNLEGQAFHSDCWIIAADGDRLAGATTLADRLHVGAMYTDFTGVDRAYRGRQIALALKLLSIRTARRYGAVRLRTNNDAANAPMLAINRKLGYRSEPGVYLMEKIL